MPSHHFFPGFSFARPFLGGPFFGRTFSTSTGRGLSGGWSMKPSQETAFSFSIAPGFPAVWGPFVGNGTVFLKRNLSSFFFKRHFLVFFFQKMWRPGFLCGKAVFFFFRVT